MQSNSILNAVPRGPWETFASPAPAAAQPRARAETMSHDHRGHGPRIRDTEFARQVLSTEILSALQRGMHIGASVPMAGLTPAESAGQLLAGAASQALSSHGGGAEALRTSLSAGLSVALPLLEELGISAEEISTLAEDVRTLLESMIGAAAGLPSDGSTSPSTIAAGMKVTQKQKTELELVTQEGDTVQLTLRQRTGVSVAGAASGDAGGVASAATATLISSSRLEISVDGNLNEDEIAAIRDVLAQVETVADEFFQGDVQAAFAAAEHLTIDSEQLASVSLEMKLKQRVQGAVWVHQPSVALPPSVANSGSASPAAAPVPASGEIPTIPAATGETETIPTAAVPAEQPRETTAGNTSASPVTLITDYFTRILDNLRDLGEIRTASLAWQSKLELLLAATYANSEPQSEPAAPGAA